ncbi:hypothetical protein [Vibrio tapetis]|uniref:Lipoprotein n=1 Tax=Vibrio tapetis subsp. tapetis TaxID=1671868 RepID=A0A2N8ZA57_9VIBR|nr:hypothetical protein [Vibrio tapetis]SON48780.1 conserved exported protein of unknown function [Vibrio tapetis subsp. tapetis]
MTSFGKIIALVLAASTLGGCSAYNMAKAAKLQSDYNLLTGQNEAIFNSDNGNQYMIPAAHDERHPKMLVCSQINGLFVEVTEDDLREVANEFLTKNKPGLEAGAGEEQSAVANQKICWEFEINQPQPIGAYLDEETGEVVVVGQSN